MKKLFAVAAAVLAGTALFAFAGCDRGTEGGLAGLDGGFGGGAGTQAEEGAQSAYALGAVTTAGLLAGGSGAVRSISLAAQTEEGALREEVADFNEYFRMLDSFLDEDAFRTEVTENSDASYPFDYKLTVTGKNPDGSEVSHTMYYSETQTHSREESDDGEHETTVAYSLTGVLEMNGVAYEMTGARMSQTETEDGEQETSESLWIRATDPADASNYVRMDVEEESEQEGGESESEREYVYSVYSGGRLAERTSVSFEKENEHGEAETEYELSILKDGVRSRFEVERAERVNGAVSIGVKYDTAEGKGRFVITQTADGQYRYTFDDGRYFDFDD